MVDQTAPSVQALGEAYAPQTVPSADAAREAVLSGAADAAVVPDPGSPAGVSVLAMTDAPSGLVQALSTSPGVELLDPAAPNLSLIHI